MSKTKIEWAEEVWNPVTGCTRISEGCQNCYAERMSKRLAGRCGYPDENPFKVTLHPERLEQPLKWKTSRKVFVCSMGDLFHEEIEPEFIQDIFLVMEKAPQHIFIILTKRPDNMRKLLHVFYSGRHKLPSHIWIGVTAENQQRADERIPILLQIPAAVRFVSIEPMLGPVNLERYIWCISREHGARLNRLHWVICGGETGSGARPIHPDWVRSLRDQCQDSGTPFFFKQWGEWAPGFAVAPKGSIRMKRVGKKKAGNLLDGRKWEEYP